VPRGRNRSAIIIIIIINSNTSLKGRLLKMKQNAEKIISRLVLSIAKATSSTASDWRIYQLRVPPSLAEPKEKESKAMRAKAKRG